MTNALKVDFVSDISCPWCAVGLKSLQQAIDNLGDEVTVDMHFQPFELNPDMPAEGQDAVEHLSQKYGINAEQIAKNAEGIRQRGAEVGFTFNQRHRVYNTFDAHRLLHWAGEVGTQQQLALKLALLTAYFTDEENPGDHDLLLEKAAEVGLDRKRAAEILASDEYSQAVRERQAFYQSHGIHAVPAVIINDSVLVSGAQPVRLYTQALRDADQKSSEPT